tara:strand:+ start:10199 stop:11188 length:990 start_codon:yes stop_codon:yes gene_type:complete
MQDFKYLINKILESPIRQEPFPHIYIEDFFTEHHFNEIISSPEINIKPSSSDQDIFKNLFGQGYKIIDFPGCIVDQDQYIKWHADPAKSSQIHSSTEGYGMTLRLMEPLSSTLIDIKNFIESDLFSKSIAMKFNISSDDVYSDNGVQKYLDGYEISPHPDIRKKALTYMININPHDNSNELEHHTHYLSLKDKYKYVESFWEGNKDYERCWVPWDWCKIEFTQSKNNSLVMFSPDDSTIHAVKADYDHLKNQRTQLYGNLWFNQSSLLKKLEWESLEITSNNLSDSPMTLTNKLKKIVPLRLKNIVKNIISKDKSDHYQDVRNKPDDYI